MRDGITDRAIDRGIIASLNMGRDPKALARRLARAGDFDTLAEAQARVDEIEGLMEDEGKAQLEDRLCSDM